MLQDYTRDKALPSAGEEEVVCAPVLSVHQPWANAIAFAGKRVENRSWETRYRGPVFIHATMSNSQMRAAAIPLDNDLWVVLDTALRQFEARTGQRVWYDRGALVAVARIVGVTSAKEEAGPCQWFWWHGPFGWHLDDVRAIFPLPHKGSHGFKYNTPLERRVQYRERRVVP